MRKAAWGAILLGIFALTFGSPIREWGVATHLHEILSVFGIAGYILISLDLSFRDPRHRQLLIAGAVCSLVAVFLIAPTGGAVGLPVLVLARVLTIASIALPLWLEDRVAQFAFVAAGALAVATGFVSGSLYATSLHAYVAAAAAFWVAFRLASPGAMPWSGDRKPPRLVVASNIVRLTPAEKAARLERIEKRFRDGEIPEHKYWDLRQELDSK